jgi:FkbM family methyltransferase
MRELLLRIFNGQEYPVIRPPAYAPRGIVDIGANVGAFAILMAGAFPNTPIHCFEPASENLQYLRANTAQTPLITVHPVALSDQSGEANLYHGNYQSMQHSLFRSIETTERFERVRVQRASEAMKAIEPSILKIDTEGRELTILRDLGESLERVDFLYVEYHAESDRRDIDSLLEGFTLGASNAPIPHRGMNLYYSNQIMGRYPQFGEACVRR